MSLGEFDKTKIDAEGKTTGDDAYAGDLRPDDRALTPRLCSPTNPTPACSASTPRPARRRPVW